MSVKSQKVHYEPGELIVHEKTACDALYIIESGQVEVYRMGKDDQRIPLGIARSGQYLGEMSLLTGSNHTASAVALTDVTTIRLDKTAINHQLETAPPWLVALTRGLVDRLIIANNMLIRHNIIDDSLVSAISAIEVKQKASEEKNPPKIPKTSQNETISKKTETATSDKPKPKKEGNKAS